MIRNGIIRNENTIRNEKPGRKILKPDREIRKINRGKTYIALVKISSKNSIVLNAK